MLTEGDKAIHVEVREQVGIIAIDRPHRFNSLDVETARDLRKAGIRLARDRAIRCGVIRGLPNVFCSGADLKYIGSGADAAELGYLRPQGAGGGEPGYGGAFKEILEYIHATISEIRRAPKPFIAAVQGVAAAGGFGLAMSCDLVFAGNRATFEWSYSRTGLTGAESSTFFLPRLLGLRRSMELVLLNPRLSAAEAKEVGLINRVFADETFEQDWFEIARRLASGPTEAFGAAKGLINRAIGADELELQLQHELDNLTAAADASEFAEGLDAFVGKRKPRF